MKPFFKTFTTGVFKGPDTTDREIELFINSIIDAGYLIIKSHIGHTVIRDTTCTHVALFCKKLNELDELVKREEIGN